MSGVKSLVALTVLVAAGLAPSVVGAAPGELDRSFGTGGTATVPLAGTLVADVGIDADGRIVVGGSSGDLSRRAFTLLRLLSSGQLDPSFGTGGVVRALDDDSGFTGLKAIVPLRDGGLVAAGDTKQGMGVLRVDDSGQTVWVRHHQLGRPYAFPNRPDVVSAGARVTHAALVGDKIMVSGSASRGGTTNHFDPMLARLNVSDGSLDRSFGEEGRLIAPRPAGKQNCFISYTWFISFVVRADGSIVAGGIADCTGNQETAPAVLRAYTTSGEPVAGFETDPIAATSLRWLRAGPDTTLTAVGRGVTGEVVLMRFTSSGALAGEPVPLGPPGAAAPVVFVAQPDERLVGPSGANAMRFLPDGSLDESFGRAGQASIGHGAQSIALQSDGRIVVAGQRAPDDAFAISRLLGGMRAGVPSVRARRASVQRRRVSIPIACGPRGASTCRGTVKITATGRRHTSFARARTFNVTAGKQRTLRLTLNSTARRRIALAPRHRLTVRLAITAGGRTTQRRLVLTT